MTITDIRVFRDGYPATRMITLADGQVLILDKHYDFLHKANGEKVEVTMEFLLELTRVAEATFRVKHDVAHI